MEKIYFNSIQATILIVLLTLISFPALTNAENRYPINKSGIPTKIFTNKNSKEINIDVSDIQDGEKCSPEYEKYSEDRYQWAKYKLCVTLKYNVKYRLYEFTFDIHLIDMQYFSGIWHKNIFPWDMENELTTKINNNETEHFFFRCKGESHYATCSYTFTTDESGKYSFNINSFLQGMGWPLPDNPHSQISIRNKFDYGEIGQKWNDAFSKLKKAIDSANKNPVLYFFGRDNQLPMLSEDKITQRTSWQAGSLLIIPLAQKAEFSLIGDFNVRASRRCEKDKDAFIPGPAEAKSQKNEVFFPAPAWGFLNQPLVALSVAFIDIRKQDNGKTWLDTGCANVFGTYIDSFKSPPYSGTPTPSPDSPFPNYPAYITPDQEDKVLDAMILESSESSDNNYRTRAFVGVQENNDTTGEQAHLIYESLQRSETSKGRFSMASGIALFPLNQKSKATGRFSATTRTKRIAVIWSNNILYILSLGINQSAGVTRKQLQDFLRALDVTNERDDVAIEFFDGPTANMVVRNDDNLTVLGEVPKAEENNCQNTGAICFFYGGEIEPSSAWMGVTIRKD